MGFALALSAAFVTNQVTNPPACCCCPRRHTGSIMPTQTTYSCLLLREKKPIHFIGERNIGVKSNHWLRDSSGDDHSSLPKVLFTPTTHILFQLRFGVHIQPFFSRFLASRFCLYCSTAHWALRASPVVGGVERGDWQEGSSTVPYFLFFVATYCTRVRLLAANGAICLPWQNHIASLSVQFSLHFCPSVPFFSFCVCELQCRLLS